jgi:hypothetical protein
LTQSIADRVPDLRSPGVGSNEFGSAEMRLKLKDTPRRSFGFIGAAEVRQGCRAQNNGEAEAGVRLARFVAHSSRLRKTAGREMSDAEGSQLQVDRRIVWAPPQRSLAIINRLRDPPVVGENGGAEPSASADEPFNASA